MCNLKYDTNELIYETERLTDIKNKLMVTKGERDFETATRGLRTLN